MPKVGEPARVHEMSQASNDTQGEPAEVAEQITMNTSKRNDHDLTKHIQDVIETEQQRQEERRKRQALDRELQREIRQVGFRKKNKTVGGG
jgi:nucleosome binding factor SPN SPT16 subunit